MIENRHNVPKALWRKFTEAGQIAYNNVRAQGRMDFMSHPKAKLSPEEWVTIAHNFAVLAAFEVKDTLAGGNGEFTTSPKKTKQS